MPRRPILPEKKDLLAGTALMFSTRFLLMAIGSALVVGQRRYLVIRWLSSLTRFHFSISAVSVWLIPEEAVRESADRERDRAASRS